MQILMIPGLVLVYFVYILYRLLITKDLKKHLWEFYTGLIFMGIWAILFYVISR